MLSRNWYCTWIKVKLQQVIEHFHWSIINVDFFFTIEKWFNVSLIHQMLLLITNLLKDGWYLKNVANYYLRTCLTFFAVFRSRRPTSRTLNWTPRLNKFEYKTRCAILGPGLNFKLINSSNVRNYSTRWSILQKFT